MTLKKSGGLFSSSLFQNNFFASLHVSPPFGPLYFSPLSYFLFPSFSGLVFGAKPKEIPLCPTSNHSCIKSPRLSSLCIANSLVVVYTNSICVSWLARQRLRKICPPSTKTRRLQVFMRKRSRIVLLFFCRKHYENILEQDILVSFRHRFRCCCYSGLDAKWTNENDL